MLTREKLTILEDQEAVSRYVAVEITAVLGKATAVDGTAHLVVAGGSTFNRVYQLLAEQVVEWPAVSVYFGDERCVGPEDPRSNYGQFHQHLLSKLPARNQPVVYRIEGELEPAAAAGRYAEVLAGRGFDLTLLGVGPDGHTASLFPHFLAALEGLPETDAVVCPQAGLEPFVTRITMTPSSLARSKRILAVATGKGKAAILAQALQDGEKVLPISRIMPDPEVIIDKDAAPEL